MSTTNEHLEKTLADDTGSAFSPLEDILGELRAVVSSHLEAGALLIEAIGIRLAFAVAVTVLAALALMLGWAIGCGVALYYLSLATSPLWAAAAGITVHLVIAVALFKFAYREIGRLRSYFDEGLLGGGARVDRSVAE